MDSATGLLVESVWLMPVVVIAMAWLYNHHRVTFLHTSVAMDLVLVGAGVVTVVPLLLFAIGARRLRTIGLLQSITPTLQFLTGVFVLGAPFTHADAVTFACIWAGLALYSADILRQRGRNETGRSAPAEGESLRPGETGATERV